MRGNFNINVNILLIRTNLIHILIKWIHRTVILTSHDFQINKIIKAKNTTIIETFNKVIIVKINTQLLKDLTEHQINIRTIKTITILIKGGVIITSQNLSKFNRHSWNLLKAKIKVKIILEQITEVEVEVGETIMKEGINLMK
jgi:hypothetical protein